MAPVGQFKPLEKLRRTAVSVRRRIFLPACIMESDTAIEEVHSDPRSLLIRFFQKRHHDVGLSK